MTIAVLLFFFSLITGGIAKATKARVFTTNAAIAIKLCRGIQLGSRFVFLDTNQITPEPFNIDTGVHPALLARIIIEKVFLS